VLNGDTIPQVPTNAPVDQQIVAINRIIDLLNLMLKQIVLSDSTTRRMFIGYQKDGWGDGKDFGFKVSVPGVDVLQATDDQLLFKMDIETWYWYDSSTKANVFQVGKLPDSTFGWATANTGYNVSDGIK
jgi:hypothetical protein